MASSDVLLYGVGDVRPNRDNPESIVALVAPFLKEADIRFGQLETTFSERGAAQMAMLPGNRSHPRNVKALTCAGFDVVSFAGNHTLDWGTDALLDTIDIVKQNGIAIIGVGKNLEEARKPVIIERKGIKVAFLAYCSVLPKGYEAWPDKPGAAPMRASTFYEQVDWQPGTPPRILSFANKEDLEAMKEDIRKVRPLADVVVLSLHWGVHFVPAVIAMYQKEVAYAAIDAGVDLILGHHAHILKGIEVYKGKVIFYSLCNFAFDLAIQALRRHLFHDHYGWEVDPEYPTYAFPADSRKAIMAKCIISDRKIAKVSYLPVMVNKQSQPEILKASDKRSQEVVDYMNKITQDQKLGTEYTWDGDEVVVAT